MDWQPLKCSLSRTWTKNLSESVVTDSLRFLVQVLERLSEMHMISSFMKKLLEPVSQTHRNISKIHIVDMATSTAQSFVPRGASARACGASHIAAQQGNTGSLKLLFDLDRTFCSSNLCSGGVLWWQKNESTVKWYHLCWLVYRADSSPIEGWVFCWSCKYCLFVFMHAKNWLMQLMNVIYNFILYFDIFCTVVLLFCPCYLSPPFCYSTATLPWLPWGTPRSRDIQGKT